MSDPVTMVNGVVDTIDVGYLDSSNGFKKLSDRDFSRLSEFIHGECGLKLFAKKTLLESRLQKRLRALNYGSFEEYCDFLFTTGVNGDELVHMIDLVTTNKTDFFRESHHFDFLSETVLPQFSKQSGAPMRIWSAGCSTGEEPYTLAIVMNEFARTNAGARFDFSIHATDISTRVLEAASRGVYKEDRIEPVPEDLKRRYFLRSRDRSKGLVRVSPELRQKVSFARLNLMDEEYSVDMADIIFCRNVIIYFNKETQEELFTKFCAYLKPGGLLFIGHSETLSGMGLPLRKVSNSVYQRR